MSIIYFCLLYTDSTVVNLHVLRSWIDENFVIQQYNFTLKISAEKARYFFRDAKQIKLTECGYTLECEKCYYV